MLEKSANDSVVAALRASLPAAAVRAPAAAAFASDATLRRYLVATEGAGGAPNAAAARKALLHTIEWRERTFGAQPPRCAACEEDETTHCFVPLGTAGGGDAVLYGSVPRAASHEADAAVAHFAHQIERVIPGGAAGRLTWIFDCSGFSLYHATLFRASIAHATVFSAHFPERAQKVVLLNPPAVWEICLAAARPFIDARTLAKIRVVRASSAAALAAHAEVGALALGADVVEWLGETVFASEPRPGTLPPLPRGAAGLALSPRVAVAPGGSL